jgi:hypothetical protein
VATIEPTIDTPLTLRLTQQAREKLAQISRENGVDLAAVASELVERAVTKPSVDELLAPYRQQVKESGLSDEELDAFHRDLLQKVRDEKRAKSA